MARAISARAEVWVTLALLLIVVAGDARGAVPCELREQCSVRSSLAHRPPHLGAELEYAATHATERPRQSTALTHDERNAFSGIGAIVCNAAGQRSTSTAFLVGGFDIAVTVAHTFERNGRWAIPSECFYTSIAAAGDFYERIPLLSFRAQWQVQPETFGEPAADLAVARLREPVRFAHRTMSLTQFAYEQAPVVLVGFPADLVIDPRKRKSRGNVYQRRGKACVRFAHDVDSRNLTPGAPLIDVRDGVVIGIHTRLEARRVKSARNCRERGNGMIPMNNWLKQAIRAEIGSSPMPHAGEASAGQ